MAVCSKKMSCHGIVIILLQLLVFCALPCCAEELEPRRWAHLPIDTNFFGTAYAYSEADISFDPVLKIEDGKAEIHTWGAKYIRTFSLLNRSARIDLLQAHQDGRWTGLLNGVEEKVTRHGWSDTLVRFAINLYGAPPLRGQEYLRYRNSVNNETIIGAGLSVQLPTGEYLEDKLINLGTNRYTFRPQLGVVYTPDKWSLEVTGMVALYTQNNDFFNNKKLEQAPLYIIHGHLIYNFRPGVWVGASAGYNYGGRSTVDGDSKDDRKQNLGWALSFGLPLSRHLGAKLAYVGTRTQESTGTDSDSIVLALSAFY